jgi:hypothetical protein
MFSSQRLQLRGSGGFAPPSRTPDGLLYIRSQGQSQAPQTEPCRPLRLSKVDVQTLFTSGLFPVSSNLDEIDVSSIQATGAIVNQGTPTVEFVDLNEDGSADFIKLTFAKGRPSQRQAAVFAAGPKHREALAIRCYGFPKSNGAERTSR